MTNELLTIGAFSMLTRLTPKALRYYEEKGLLVPAKKEITGYRFYGFEQVGRGLLLQRLSGLGFGIQEMRAVVDIIDGRADRSSIGPVIGSKVAEVKERMNELERIREVLERNDLERILDMSQDIPRIVDIAPMRVVTKRERGAYGEVIPRLLGEVYAAVMAQPQARLVGPPLTIYHDVDASDAGADLEVGAPVAGPVAADNGLEVRTLDGGRAVTAVHRGPYDMVGEAWGRVLKYAQENGLRTVGAAREFYLNDPNVTPASELLTEVQLPVG